MNTITYIILFFILSCLTIFFIYTIYKIIKLFSINCNHIKVNTKSKLKYNQIIFRDGYKTNYSKWIVLGSDNVFVLFHGLNSSLNDIKLIQKYLEDKNETVYSFDQRNYGTNKTKKCYHFGTLRDDYYDFIQLILEKHPNKNIILFCHSMSVLVMSLVLKKYNNLNKKIKFIFLNYPTKYLINSKIVDDPKKNSIILKILEGIYFDAKVILRYLDFELKIKFLRSKNNKNLNFFSIRKVPFYLFANFIFTMFFFKKTISNIKDYKIWIFIGTKDEYTNWKTIKKHKIKFQNLKNINFKFIKDIKHNIVYNKKTVKKVFDIIYNDVLN